MIDTFPGQFRGISVVVTAGDPIEFEAAVTHLIRGCNGLHAHNFAIEMDAVPPRIYTTELGAKCVQEARQK